MLARPEDFASQGRAIKEENLMTGSMNARAVWMESTSLALCLAAFGAGNAEAKVTKIEITKAESPTFEGRSFDKVGQYEKLVGRAYGEVDPRDPRNAVIVD